MQLALKAAVLLCDTTRNDGYWTVQGHRFWYQLKARIALAYILLPF